ncbi:MAG: glycosyl hydrolase [Armatimonadota bacterium]|nr:glycosyl hydrolase [Armatimonadota bacterium]
MWAELRDYDRFGGWKLAGWTEKPTGFYRLRKRDGFWWLITPEGNPCFYLGLCTAPALNWPATPVSGREYLFEWLPPKEGDYAFAWRRGAWGGDEHIDYIAFHTANLVRKYGDGWSAKAVETTRRRLRSWGFSGVGKWGEIKGLPFVPVLTRADVPCLVKHPEIFDPAIQTKFVESLRKQIEPRRDDPMVVGWSFGNEFDEIITADEICEILKKPDVTPAKKELLRRVPDGNIEEMRRCYARAYYEFVYRTIKSIDPNHLYFGFWIVPGWWENEEDWRLVAPYCDAIGYDLYSFEFGDERLIRLAEKSGKPIICGEFSFPPFYNGERGFGCYAVYSHDDAHSGKLYGDYVRAAACNPYCVGVMWFEYRDQPITGRGAGKEIGPVIGEHYAFGFVDVADRPKWDLVKRAREANLSAVKWRLEAARKNARH